MTLKQAQKLYEDSVQAKMTHADNCMTQSQLEYIGIHSRQTSKGAIHQDR